jgi:hypothetical protein
LIWRYFGYLRNGESCYYGSQEKGGQGVDVLEITGLKDMNEGSSKILSPKKDDMKRQQNRTEEGKSTKNQCTASERE